MTDSNNRSLKRSPRLEMGLLLLLTLLAFGLRLWRLDSVPPGWRDDELINSLVISQKVLDGNLAVYYADASGHEALYHALNAIFLGIFGPGVPGIRWLSAILGSLSVPLTYLLGKRMFSLTVGWVAAAGLTVSFWSLMYSRIGLRHILLPLLVLLAFNFFWQSLTTHHAPLTTRYVLLTAVFVSLGFYTYFAGRGVPLILLAFIGYLWLVRRDLFRQRWRQWALMFGVMVALALPLVVTLQRQPEAEGRVGELAVPLTEARQGNFAPLVEYTLTTLSMFHNTGDGEWLYNIPGRPIFGLIGALFLWLGVGFTIYDLRFTIGARRRPITDYRLPITDYRLPAAFLLLWWLAGIAPAFVSVPPASLGHTILAQPATYLLAAIPVWRLEIRDWRWRPISNLQSLISFFLGLLLVGSIAARDLPDYFVTWPQRGMVRFLYRADIREVAQYLNDHAEVTDFGISGLLAGPWDRLALEMGLDEDTAVFSRWYNPERAVMLMPPLSFAGQPRVTAVFADWLMQTGEQAGGYTLNRVNQSLQMQDDVCFTNGLCWIAAHYDADAQTLDLAWRVRGELDLPPFALFSNPPPPGVYSGPRLAVFAQVWDVDGRFLTGDDGLWVDPYTLQPGDVFMQQHHLPLTDAATPATIAFGLYDPMTGQRILTEDGRELLQMEISDQ